jgi:hypothetical protein
LQARPAPPAPPCAARRNLRAATAELPLRGYAPGMGVRPPLPAGGAAWTPAAFVPRPSLAAVRQERADQNQWVLVPQRPGKAWWTARSLSRLLHVQAPSAAWAPHASPACAGASACAGEWARWRPGRTGPAPKCPAPMPAFPAKRPRPPQAPRGANLSSDSTRCLRLQQPKIPLRRHRLNSGPLRQIRGLLRQDIAARCTE